MLVKFVSCFLMVLDIFTSSLSEDIWKLELKICVESLAN